jgi:two-component system chemotaxis response regulator CheY
MCGSPKHVTDLGAHQTEVAYEQSFHTSIHTHTHHQKEVNMSLGRILVVDDEADVRKSVHLTLKKAGYEVVEAEDGEKGIAAIRSGDNPLMVDAVICDIHMPKINGNEAIVWFRSQFPSVPIVVMTGKPDLAGATDLMKQGVADYLVKPVEAEKLIAVINKVAKPHVYKDPFKT